MTDSPAALRTALLPLARFVPALARLAGTALATVGVRGTGVALLLVAAFATADVDAHRAPTSGDTAAGVMADAPGAEGLHPPEAAFGAAYWIARWPGAERVTMDATAVAAHNARLFDADPAVTRLDALPATLSTDAIRSRVVALSTGPTAPRYGEDGRLLGATDHQRWSDALGLRALEADAGERPVGWALVTRRAALRTFPTHERVFRAPGESDLDRFQESAFFPGTPVAVLHTSADGRWRFVVGPTYAAWIEDDALAHTDRDTALDFAARAGRVVLEPVARLAATPEAPAVSGLELDMGVALPERRGASPSLLVNGQGALGAHVVEVPLRDADGALALTAALLPRGEASHDGPLPASRANVLRQAFRFLGERYGWGHANGARDCSGFVSEVYRSLGLVLPRNTGDQARSPALARQSLAGLDRAARLAAVGASAPGDLLYLPGHVVMVVGHDAQGPWVIHDVHRLRVRDAEGALVEWRANGVVLTPLLPLHIDASTDYLDAATTLVRVLPADTTGRDAR
ncbi:SH3 domain-containing protein [Silanimonas algicola]